MIMGSIKLEDKDRLGGISNILAHEIRHTLQETDKWRSSPDKSRWATTDTALNVDSYTGNTAETGVRLANLVQQYYKDTGKLITNSQQASDALRRYGFVAGVNNNAKVAGDVIKLRNLYHKLPPAAQKEMYKRLTEQMPGLVKQAYQQTYGNVS